jgi:acetoacetate decarboxylase
MGFLKNADEIRAMQEALAAPRFVNAEMLSVVFESDADYLRSILPPPLELTDASVRAMVGRWQSNCVGDFAGGALYVPARHGGVDGEYVLAMYMTTDAAIIYGRELFGEPKKQCTTGLHRGASTMVGWIDRHGVRLIDLRAELDTELAPSSAIGVTYNIKATPSCTGVGLEDDAILTLAEFDVTLTAHRTGTGTVTLASTPHDPLGDIPIGAVRDAIHQEGDLVPTCRRVATIPAATYLPYAYGRMDDWSRLNTVDIAVAV